MNELIPLNNATQIVAICEDAARDVSTALELLDQARIKLKNVFGTNGADLFHDWKLNQLGSREIPGCKATIKNSAWRFIADKVQIRTLLSIKKQEELDKQLDPKNASGLPEVTEENIFEFINSMLGKASTLVEESLQEVFDIFRPHKDYHPFKTNHKFEMGKKVFLNNYFDTTFNMCRIHYHREKDMAALDKLFHLLDGKPAPQYPCGVVTIINEATRNKKWEVETEYFKLQWYKKGSLHIEFKRLDLVKEINKRAGGMRLTSD